MPAAIDNYKNLNGKQAMKQNGEFSGNILFNENT